jgi:hypothetical protein
MLLLCCAVVSACLVRWQLQYTCIMRLGGVAVVYTQGRGACHVPHVLEIAPRACSYTYYSTSKLILLCVSESAACTTRHQACLLLLVTAAYAL